MSNIITLQNHTIGDGVRITDFLSTLGHEYYNFSLEHDVNDDTVTINFEKEEQPCE